jgi:hypothetical protein
VDKSIQHKYKVVSKPYSVSYLWIYCKGLDYDSIVWYNISIHMITLTPQQEQFVLNYTTQGIFYSNGVLSYANAYNYTLPVKENGDINTKSSEYTTCNVCACKLLQSANIQERLQEIYLAMLNDKTMDARLSEIATKGKDTDSIQALKIYNDLKQRITKKIDITTAGRPLQGLSDDELARLAE